MLLLEIILSCMLCSQKFVTLISITADLILTDERTDTTYTYRHEYVIASSYKCKLAKMNKDESCERSIRYKRHCIIVRFYLLIIHQNG